MIVRPGIITSGERRKVPPGANVLTRQEYLTLSALEFGYLSQCSYRKS